MAAVLVVLIVIRVVGARGSVVVKATSQKVKGLRYDEVNFFNLPNHSGLTRPQVSLSF
jgi:hypothetical protein